MKNIKIISGEITNLPLLEEIVGPKKLLSMGMTNIQEIKDALIILNKCGTKK